MIFKAQNFTTPSYLREDSLWQSLTHYIFKYGSQWIMLDHPAYRLSDGTDYPLVPALGLHNGKEFYLKLDEYDGSTMVLFYDGVQYVLTDYIFYKPYLWETEVAGVYKGPSYYICDTILGEYQGRGSSRGLSITIEIFPEDLDTYTNTEFLGKYTNTGGATKYVGLSKLVDDKGTYYSKLDDFEYDTIIRYKNKAMSNYLQNRIWRGYTYYLNSNYLFGDVNIKVTEIYPLYSSILGAIKTFTINSSGTGHITGEVLNNYSANGDAKIKVTEVDIDGMVIAAVIYADNNGAWENHTDYLPENEDLPSTIFTRYWCGDGSDPNNYDLTLSFDSYFMELKGTRFYGCEVPVVYAGGGIITSWSSNGMDWDNVNPINRDYSRAIYFALLDRGAVPFTYLADFPHYLFKHTNFSASTNNNNHPNESMTGGQTSQLCVNNGSMAENLDYLDGYDYNSAPVPYPELCVTYDAANLPLMKGASLENITRQLSVDDCISFQELMWGGGYDRLKRLTNGVLHKKALRLQYLILNQIKSIWYNLDIYSVILTYTSRHRGASGTTYGECMSNLSSAAWTYSGNYQSEKSLSYHQPNHYSASETEVLTATWKLKLAPYGARFPMKVFTMKMPHEVQNGTTHSFLPSGKLSDHLYIGTNADVSQIDEDVNIYTDVSLGGFPATFGGGTVNISVYAQYQVAKIARAAFIDFDFKE
jgi:hypothetical protein